MMRRKVLTGSAWLLVMLMTLLATLAVAADKKAKLDELNGAVRVLNKDKSTITVRKDNIERQIIYNADTKFVLGTAKNHKPSSVDELKEGWYVHCFGTFEGNNLVAKSCRFREAQNTTAR